MKKGFRRYVLSLVGLIAVVSLLGAMACGGADEATPSAEPVAEEAAEAEKTAREDVGETALTVKGVEIPSAPIYPTDAEIGRLLDEWSWFKHEYGEPQYGGIVRSAGYWTSGHQYDPVKPGAQIPIRAIYDDGLAGMDVRNQENLASTVPMCIICESWEIAPDNMSITFKIRPEVTWQNIAPLNGARLTAHDVKASYDFYMDADQSPPGHMRALFTSPQATAVEAPDDTTVIVRFAVPSAASFLYSLTWSTPLTIFPVDLHNDDSLTTRPIGSGAFMMSGDVAENLKPGDSVPVLRNPDYWGVDNAGRTLPFVDGWTIFGMPDADTQRAAFRAKQLDNIDQGAVGTPDQVVALQKQFPGVRVGAWPQHPIANTRIMMKLDHPILSNVNVRRALSMAANRQDMIDISSGGAGIPVAPIPYPWMGRIWPLELHELGPYYQYNPDEARRLLAQEGYADGFEFEMIIASSNLVRQYWADGFNLLGSNWEQVGVKFKMIPLEGGAFNPQWNTGQFNMGAFRCCIHVGSDLNAAGFDVWHTDGPYNRWGYSNAELDALLDASVAEPDLLTRQAMAREINDFLVDQVTSLELYIPWIISMSHEYLVGNWDHLWGWTTAGGHGIRKYVYLTCDAPTRDC
jgi:peptide/nickel transport system substrate-binding protein